MSHDQMTESFNDKTTRTYATEANLIAGLEKLGFAEHRHLRVRVRSGRWTAVFPVSNISNGRQGGYLGLYAQHGFLTMG